MYDRLLENVLTSVEKYPEEYEKSVASEIHMYIDNVNLPLRYQKQYIDTKKLTTHIKQLYSGFEDIIASDNGAFVMVDTFRHSGYIIAMLMEKILNFCLINDVHVPAMLYIDTNLLIENYSNVMDSNRGNGVPYKALIPEDIIANRIYTADFVFWDKFNISSLAFANRKLYEILTIRYNKCLNNMFFATESPEIVMQLYSMELYHVMNLTRVYDLKKDGLNNLKFREDN